MTAPLGAPNNLLRLLQKLHLAPRPSTLRLWRLQKTLGQPWIERLHARFYAGWPYGYIGSAIGERPGMRWLRPFFAPFLLPAFKPQAWANSYHGKVVPTASARKLIQVDEAVAAVVPEQVIPFESARDLILVADQPMAVLDCPCRSARENPCLPLDVCLIIGEPFASFILEHHPTKARAVDGAEALDILEQEAARGHVHHAFFKEAMAQRFYAICNCCSCCCGAMAAHRHDTPMLISSGYVARVDEARCIACGRCAEQCPFGVIHLDGTAQIDSARCMGCGVCVRLCPQGALQLELDPLKPAPLDPASVQVRGLPLSLAGQ